MSQFFEVDRYSDEEWGVFSRNEKGELEVEEDGLFTCWFYGSLADCEAWIRLKEQGRLTNEN